MSGAVHEVLLEMLRARPELSLALARLAAGVVTPSYSRIESRDTSFVELRLPEYRADLFLLLEDDDGNPVFAIVVEAQLEKDDSKHFSWPVYLAVAHARHQCPVALLVVTLDEEVAAWARRPFWIGPGMKIRPVVVGPSDFPSEIDVATAKQTPELVMLAARMRGEATTIERVIDALGALDEEHRELYYDFVKAGLDGHAAAVLEALMQTKGREYLSDFAKKNVAEGFDRGLRQGRQEGRQEAALEVRAEIAGALRSSILGALAERALPVSEAERATIEAESDLGRLLRWSQRAATATDIAQLIER
ncbi:MAG: hypothetical protein HYV07_09430 [Deltaproteobacteria bacterium]|nr:hypothetical protein [Deltaproteobacteria bacterium]